MKNKIKAFLTVLTVFFIFFALLFTGVFYPIYFLIIVFLLVVIFFGYMLYKEILEIL
jgi:hypothetical protein